MKDLVAVENYGKNNCVAKLIAGRQHKSGSDRTHYYKQPTRYAKYKHTDATYLVNLLLKIQYIVHQYCYGISINNLYNEISNILGGWFKFD